MRVVCSIFLSALMVCPSFGQSSGQPTQQTKDQPPAQKPETVSLKQPLAFGLEDGTPIKLRLTRNLSSADATTGDLVDFEVLEDVKVKDVIVVPRGGLALATIGANSTSTIARENALSVWMEIYRESDEQPKAIGLLKQEETKANDDKVRQRLRWAVQKALTHCGRQEQAACKDAAADPAPLR